MTVSRLVFISCEYLMKTAFIFSVSHSFTSCSLANVALGFAVTLNLGFKGELCVHFYPAEDTIHIFTFAKLNGAYITVGNFSDSIKTCSITVLEVPSN